MKRIIAAFDFDGTLTIKDTFIEFIKFTKGNTSLYWGLLLYSPILIAYKLGIYPNWKAKQKIFSFYFKNMEYSTFKEYGIHFKKVISNFENSLIVEYLNKYRINGKSYIITASIEDWVIPWTQDFDNIIVIGTKVEIENGKLTGKFSTPNCYGKEKVIRLLELEPNRNSYVLHAFGDSKGDKELLQCADRAFIIKNKRIAIYD